MAENRLKPKCRQSDVVVQFLENEVLIYDLLANKAYCLNETAAAVWKKCNGNKSISDITNELRSEIDSSIKTDFVLLAIEQFRKDKLIVDNNNFSAFAGGDTRRKLIRKVGFASVIALPIVSSIVAPNANHAQSGCSMGSGRPDGCSCTNQGHCNNCCSLGTCSPNGTQSNGDACSAGCSCSGGCCVSGVCFPAATLATGAACTQNCQCISGSCPNATDMCD